MALYLIGLPIGNLNEINNRAISVLNDLQIIFSEHTDNLKKILNLLNINFADKKIISYHKFNETSRFDEVSEYLKNNDVGIVSDAGFPCINDPGQKLVNYLRNNNYNDIICINGSNAALCALAASGFDSSRFYYGGFFGYKKQEIINELNERLKYQSTLIYYEAVHRIKSTLEIIEESFPDLKVCVARELTKKFETFYFGKISEIIGKIEYKGEFVLLINKPSINKNHCEINESIIEELNLLIKYNMRPKDACKYLADKYNLKSSNLYAFCIKQK
ncbi:16S rRNA (cytidine(1402)-2'-O)-methyltransferase [Mycoplasma sp. T363T]|uniref:16S rRNA (cytidine(1402)-2'-O)-methyltransferase n=1 Tax=Mycoplasma bradburyae TaxID=2963128 RepID=UPI00233FE735|nr:16S rRNA (cytidine(1402)-2'-O)-methyltransferase [Mycoplasma bradburyae]MDC4163076.1 16S rRNA (cytidine(1402)-2'-O)-methyltransferase [Mycoplasma bradburyae]